MRRISSAPQSLLPGAIASAASCITAPMAADCCEWQIIGTGLGHREGVDVETALRRTSMMKCDAAGMTSNSRA